MVEKENENFQTVFDVSALSKQEAKIGRKLFEGMRFYREIFSKVFP